MKVFGCTMQQHYSGGIILVAANSVEEAFELASTYERIDFLFNWETPDGFYAKPHAEGAVLKSSYYPFEKWHEFEHLSCDYTEPQVILEESYFE